MYRRLLACLTSLLPLCTLAHCGGDPTAPEFESSGGIVNPDGGTTGTGCKANSECQSNVCEDGVCAAPTTTTTTGGGCKADTDCPNSGCGDDGKCATAPSCTRNHGGRTCGPNGNDDCCAVVTEGDYKVDKYLITAGRMRAFIEKFGGDIQSAVGSFGDKWKPEWAEENSLPTDIDSANDLLGPYGNKKACNTGDYTGHTYWTPPDGDESSDLDQDTLDEKALNCVPWPLMQALCVWQGGHIATLDQLRKNFTNDGTTKYPWGDDGLSNVDAPDPQERLNMAFGFETTPLPATYRQKSDGSPAGVTFFISPPGRYPKGNNKAGVADSAGDLLEWTGDGLRRFVWKGDFEHHIKDASSLNFGNWWWEKYLGQYWVWGTNQLLGNAGSSNERNGYYSIGGRCAY